MNTHFKSRHFSLSNGSGPAGTNLPKLLRRMARHIEQEGIEPDDVLDIVFSNDNVNEHGGIWRATIYWSP